MSDWPGKLKNAISKELGQFIANNIVPEIPELIDEKSKAKWAQKAIGLLDEMNLDESVRWDIMSQCSCTCADDLIDEHRASYLKHKDIDRLLDEMFQRPFFVRPERKGNLIFLTKAPCHSEDFNKVTTPELKKYHYCHCDFARAAEGSVSVTHCMCGGGWYRRLFEQILGQPVPMKLTKSVMRGDDICQFSVTIPSD